MRNDPAENCKPLSFDDNLIMETLRRIDIDKCVKSIEIVDGYYIRGSEKDDEDYANLEYRLPNTFWQSGSVNVSRQDGLYYVHQYIFLRLHNLEDFDVKHSVDGTWSFRITVYSDINAEFERIKNEILGHKIKKSTKYFYLALWH